MRKDALAMQKYIGLLSDLFMQKLAAIKDTKRGLGKNYVLALREHWEAIGETVFIVSENDEYRHVLSSILWYTYELQSAYRQLLENNPNPSLSGMSQFDIAVDLHWKAREVVLFLAIQNGKFAKAGPGRPIKVANE